MQAIGGHYSFCSQYLSIDLPDDILRRLLGRNDYDDWEDTLLYARWAHETAHYVQNVTTTYGLFKTLLNRAAGLSFLQGFLDYRRLGNPISFPMSDRIERGRRSPVDATPFAIGHGLHAVLDGLEHQTEISIPMRGINAPAASTSPFVQYSGSLKAITAGSLLEFQAYAQQVITVDYTRGIPRQHADEVVAQIRTNAQVGIIWALVANAFRVSELSAPLHVVAYELVTLALSFAWPTEPLQAVSVHHFDVAPETPLLWEEVHPGWRMWSIAQHISQAQAPVPAHEDIPRFVAEIARALGWPSMQEATGGMFKLMRKHHHDLLSDLIVMEKPVTEVLAEAPLSIDWPRLVKACGTTLCRGPLAEMGRADRDAVLYDVATQLFYSNQIFCPICIASSHDEDCGIPAFVGALRSGDGI